jgi:HEAT repeat protein
MQSGRLSVSARDIPWSAFLPELEQQTGIKILVKGQLHGKLSADFQHLPIEDALKKVFRDASVAFFYSRGGSGPSKSGRLEEIWLWPKGGSASASSPEESSEVTSGRQYSTDSRDLAESYNPEDAKDKPEDPDMEAGIQTLRQALLDHDQSMQTQAFELLAQSDAPGAMDALLDLAGNEEPEIRQQALSLMSQVGQDEGPTVVSALGEALADADEGVKRYAIEALASWGNQDAMQYLRQALRDPDPFTRTLAVESVAALKEGLPLIYEAISDADPTVRSMAVYWLQRQGGEPASDHGSSSTLGKPGD